MRSYGFLGFRGSEEVPGSLSKTSLGSFWRYKGVLGASVEVLRVSGTSLGVLGVFRGRSGGQRSVLGGPETFETHKGFKDFQEIVFRKVVGEKVEAKRQGS